MGHFAVLIQLLFPSRGAMRWDRQGEVGTILWKSSPGTTGWSISFKDEAEGDTETRGLVFCSGCSSINSNLQSKVLPEKSHRSVDFVFDFEYFMHLSQQYSLYSVTEILIWISLWWSNKDNPKTCKLWANLWGNCSLVPEACLQCGRNNSSQKPETKLVTNFQ